MFCNGWLVNFLFNFLRRLAYCQVIFLFFIPLAHADKVEIGGGFAIGTVCYGTDSARVEKLKEAQAKAAENLLKCLTEQYDFPNGYLNIKGVVLRVKPKEPQIGANTGWYSIVTYGFYTTFNCEKGEIKSNPECEFRNFHCEGEETRYGSDTLSFFTCDDAPGHDNNPGDCTGADCGVGGGEEGDGGHAPGDGENPGGGDNTPGGDDGGGGDNPPGGGDDGGDGEDDKPSPGGGGPGGGNTGDGDDNEEGDSGTGGGDGVGDGEGGVLPSNPNDPNNPPDNPSDDEGGDSGGGNPGSGNNPGPGSPSPGGNGGNGDNPNPGGNGGSGGGGVSVNVDVDLCRKNPNTKLCQAAGSFSGDCAKNPVCSGDAVECAAATAVWKLACGQDARKVEGLNISSGSGLDCNSSPKCEGDAIDCAILLEQHHYHCALYSDDLAGEFSEFVSGSGNGAGEGGEWKQVFDSVVDEELPGDLLNVNSYFGVSESCPSDVIIPFFGQQITIESGWLCQFMRIIRYFFIVAAWLYVIRLFFVYFSREAN